MRFGRKNLLETLCENYYLFEKLIIRKIAKAFKERQEPLNKPQSYEEVVKQDKIEKKFRKGLLRFEEELKTVRLDKEKLEAQLKETQESLERSQKKLEYHKKMQEKARNRIENLQKLKKIWSQTPEIQKPKFQELEESFNTMHEQFEVERTKSELSKVSEKMKSVSKNELLSHLKSYQTIITEAKRIREAKLAEFSLISLVSPINHLKKEIKEEEKAKFSRKKMMMYKRKHYGDLVKEFFSPKACLRNMASEKKIVKIESPKEGKESEEYFQGVKGEKKKIKRNVTPEPVLREEEEKLGVKRNYLCEIREYRNHRRKNNNLVKDLSVDEMRGNKSEVTKKIQGFERGVLSEGQNARLNHMSSVKEVELGVKMNEQLLQSVKAKIQLIKNININ